MRVALKGKNARVTLPLQSQLDEVMSGDTIQVAWITGLFRKKLEEQGILIEENEVGAITEQVIKRIREEDGVTWETPWQFDVSHHSDVVLEFSERDVNGFAEFIDDGISSLVQETTEECASAILVSILKDIDTEHESRMREMAIFQTRLIDRWRKPFQLLSAQIALAGKYGADMNAWLRDQPFAGKTSLIEAVTRLQARATQIAGEIQVLLNHGFADGALSRWRTLHEVCIVALFIQQEGEETAQRYLDHLQVDSRDMARFMQKAASKSAREGQIDTELRQIEEEVLALCKAHGDEFDGHYGWASKAIEQKRHRSGISRSKKINPTFFDIEEAVDMDRLRPFYKLASGAVHAGPKGTFFKLGLLAQYANTILAGPSNAGLSEAGRLAAWSLGMTCTTLTMVEPSIDGIVWSSVINELGTQAGDAFLIAEKHLHEEETMGRRQRTSPARANTPYLRVMEKPSTRIRRRLAGISSSAFEQSRFG